MKQKTHRSDAAAPGETRKKRENGGKEKGKERQRIKEEESDRVKTLFSSLALTNSMPGEKNGFLSRTSNRTSNRTSF